MKSSRLPIVVIVSAALAVLGLAIVLRRDVGSPQLTVEKGNPTAEAAVEHVRSARVEERLQLLREEYAQRERAAQQQQQPHPAEDSEPRRSQPVPVGAQANAETPKPGAIARGRRASWAVQRRAAAAAQAAARKPRAPGEHRIGDPFVFHPKYLDEHWDTQRIEDTILNGTNIDQRRQGLDLLPGEDENDATRILMSALAANDPDPDFRAALVAAVEDFSDMMPLAVLQYALQDQAPQVRFEAVWVLGGMDTPDARAAIQSAVNDGDPDVRDLARGILDMQ